MATASEVKAGLDRIAETILAKRQVMQKAKADAGHVSAELDTLAATYGDVIATIQGYDASDAFEANAMAELGVLTNEFGELKSLADQVAGINLG